jgi:predicted solute-binding protein
VRREMGEERDELLLAMSYAAHQEAHKHLSEAGREVLEMMEYTSRNSGLSIADAYVEASATASLSEYDKDIIKAYLARRTLIEAFSEEALGEE